MNLNLEFVDFFQYLRIDISIAVEISTRTLYALLKQTKRKRGKRPADTRTVPIYFLSKFNDLNTFFQEFFWDFPREEELESTSNWFVVCVDIPIEMIPNPVTRYGRFCDSFWRLHGLWPDNSAPRGKTRPINYSGSPTRTIVNRLETFQSRFYFKWIYSDFLLFSQVIFGIFMVNKLL